MENIVISLVLAQVILIPLACKWELNLKVVLISGLIIGLFVGLVVSIISLYFDMNLLSKSIGCVFLILLTSVSVLIVRFYRDPDRVPPESDNVILSPADGIVKYIKHIEKGKITFSSKGREEVKLSAPLTDILDNEQGYLIGIGMSYLDVHITRAAIGGRLTYVKHVTGCFCSLKKKDAPYRNERLIEIIENDKYKIGLIQIASRLVRRIVAYVREGDELDLGQKIGMIKFGSQVDVVLPKSQDLRIKVKVGEQVYGGISIIAEI